VKILDCRLANVQIRQRKIKSTVELPAFVQKMDNTDVADHHLPRQMKYLGPDHIKVQKKHRDSMQQKPKSSAKSFHSETSPLEQRKAVP